MTRNALRFFWTNARGWARWTSVTAILFRTLRTVAAWLLKPQYRGGAFRRKAWANALAVRDFFRGRYGPMEPQ